MSMRQLVIARKEAGTMSLRTTNEPLLRRIELDVAAILVGFNVKPKEARRIAAATSEMVFASARESGDPIRVVNLRTFSGSHGNSLPN
jgi:hypothetical protein